MRSTVRLVAATAMTLWVVVGCGGSGGPGGGGDGGGIPKGKGVLRGQVVIFGYEDLPVGDVVVQAKQGATVVKTTTVVNSRFELILDPGTYTVTVVPPEGFALPSGGEQIVATVVEGVVTTLPEAFVLFEEADLPPSPP
ncbi:MAG: hypothetical protein N2512_08865 [Armatimonadetes bacterium]|nr:hypothetical protein [Armatimonadota bacterium]